MSKKTLNIDSITNELTGSSLYFAKQTTSPTLVSDNTSQVSQQTVTEKFEGTGIKTVETKPVQPIGNTKLSKETVNERPNEQINERSNVPMEEREDERTNGRMIARTNERKNERSRKRGSLRHSFDIFSDQLLSLKEIALRREIITGEKVLLGDLAKEAMDMLIAKEKNNER